jgi:hypothetical protein
MYIEDLTRYLTKVRMGKVGAPYKLYLKQVWGKLRMAWGVPPSQSIDDFVLDEIEGRGHKFVRKHRFIEERY